MPERLSEAQRAALQTMAGGARGKKIPANTAISLWRRRLCEQAAYGIDRWWVLTDAGRARLAAEEAGGG